MYTVIDTMSATGDSIGRVMSSHRTREAAEKSEASIQRATRRGCGQSSYLPLVIRETKRRVGKGAFVTADMIGAE